VRHSPQPLLCCVLDEGFDDPLCSSSAFWVFAVKDYANGVVHLTYADNKCADKIEARFFVAAFGDFILEVSVGTRHPGKVTQLSVQQAGFFEILYQAVQKRSAAMLHTDRAYRKLVFGSTTSETGPVVNGTQAHDDEVVIHVQDSTTAVANLVISAD
jgi:hypothetical protein